MDAVLRDRLAAYILASEETLCLEWHGGAWPDVGKCRDGHAEALELLEAIGLPFTPPATAAGA